MHIKKTALVCLIPVLMLLVENAIGTESSGAQLPSPAERLYRKGFSFVPPSEKGWAIIGDQEYRLTLQRTVSEVSDNAYVIEAQLRESPTARTPKEFLETIQERRSKSKDANRIKILLREETLLGRISDYCVKFYVKAEDRGAPKITKRIGPMLMESIGAYCRHPAYPKIAVYLSYTHRFYEDTYDTRFANAAEQLIDTIEFRSR